MFASRRLFVRFTPTPRMKFKRCCLFISILVLAIAWPFVDNSCPYISLLPEDASNVLADLHTIDVPEHKRNLPDTFRRPESVVTVYGYKTEREVKEFIKKSHPYETVLFKSYLDANRIPEAFGKLRGIVAGRKFRQDDQASCGLGFGGLFAHGARCTEKVDKTMSIEPILKGIRKNYYVYGNNVGNESQKLNVLFDFKEREIFDNTFFSWLTQEMVTTPMHADWLQETFSLQISGKKKWLFIDPLRLKALLSSQGSSAPFAGASGEVFFPNLHLDDTLQSHLRLAVVEPGDLLYFPAWAAHSVVTSSGLNVMTSLRFQNLKMAFSVFPWKTLQGAMFNAIHGMHYYWQKEPPYRVRLRENSHSRGDDKILEGLLTKVEL